MQYIEIFVGGIAKMIVYTLLCVIALYLFGWCAALGGSCLWCTRCRKIPVVSATTEKKEKSAAPQRKRKRWVSDFFEGLTRYTMLKTGQIPSFRLRNLLYRHIFKMKISKKTIIYAGCEFRSPYNISIGNSVIGPNNIVDGRRGVVIGDHVCTGSGVKIWTLQHDPQSASFGTKGGAVEINDFAWLASFSTILPGKKVGEGAVVSAGAIVTKDCAQYTINAGVPAVEKGIRSKDLEYELEDHWWFV